MSDSLDAHYDAVIKAIIEGKLVPFLGAGVNLCDRPEGVNWQRDHYLPSGSELAAYLIKSFGYPSAEMEVDCPACNCRVLLPEKMQDLVRISQYITLSSGEGGLYDELHKLFNDNYNPTSLHKFLATLPRILREKGYPYPYQPIVTTNYDDVLERAFEDENAADSLDLLTYTLDDQERGGFSHRPPGGEPKFLDKPNDYNLPLGQRTVILKVHGAVDRTDAQQDRYVITENDYIEYLTHTDISGLLPKSLVTKLKSCHFLFLGYSLRDWNLRAIFHSIWKDQKRRNYRSWGIQLNPKPLDEKFWQENKVDIFNERLEDYIAGLDERVRALPPF